MLDLMLENSAVPNTPVFRKDSPSNDRDDTSLSKWRGWDLNSESQTIGWHPFTGIFMVLRFPCYSICVDMVSISEQPSSSKICQPPPPTMAPISYITAGHLGSWQPQHERCRAAGGICPGAQAEYVIQTLASIKCRKSFVCMLTWG